MKPTIRFFLAALVFGMAHSLVAENPKPGNKTASTSSVKVIREPGKPFELRYSDGRSAILFFVRHKPNVLSVPFEISENTCRPYEGKGCAFDVALIVYKTELRWTEHPDPKKIGTIVSVKRKTENAMPFEVKSQESILTSEKPKKPKICSELGDDEIRCSDYRWLPGGTHTTPPPSLRILRWDAEFMTTNPETGFMENRSVGGAMDVNLSRSPRGALAITKIKHVGTRLPLFVGDVVAWILPSEEDEFCQISLKPDFRSVNAEFKKLTDSLKDTFVPYLYGTDEFTDSPSIPFPLSDLLSKPDSFEAL